MPTQPLLCLLAILTSVGLISGGPVPRSTFDPCSARISPASCAQPTPDTPRHVVILYNAESIGGSDDGQLRDLRCDNERCGVNLRGRWMLKAGSEVLVVQNVDLTPLSASAR